MRKMNWIVVVVALGIAGVAVAQEAIKRASPEMSATELCLVAQGAMDDERQMIERGEKSRVENFKKISDTIVKYLASADDVTEVAVRDNMSEKRMTGTVYTFNYLGRPAWVMFVKDDTGRGYEGENMLWFKASGRAPKDSEEVRLLGFAPIVYNNEMDRDMRRELHRRFGYDSGNVGQLTEFMIHGNLTPTLAEKMEEMFEKLRKIGDDYRTKVSKKG